MRIVLALWIAPLIAVASLAEASPNPPYTRGIRSVIVLKTMALHADPRSDSPIVGVIEKGTASPVRAAAPGGNGCEGAGGSEGRWIQLAPRGWACETALEPSTDAPTQAPSASLDEDDGVEPVRATYGVVRGKSVEAYASRADAAARTNGRVLVGANTVRAAGVVSVDGRRYWRTSRGELIDESSIARISPSSFKGVALDAASPLPAWVRARKGPRDPVLVRATPSVRGTVTGKLAARTVVTVLEQSETGAFVRIGDLQWIARADLRIAALSAPPPGTLANERWFDIDRDEQVLVAYEGERPVYATMVSTGKYLHETPTSVTRIVSKHESATMTSDKGELYSVADVPWTMYFDRDFALHTSFWHDGFGGARSHGCVNLAPRDARLLYRWSSPDVPPGWTSVYGDQDSPGSLVRVRTKTTPNPAFRGYARTMHELERTVASAR
jgi:hypothetical protein